jgi:hypothetical protein
MNKSLNGQQYGVLDALIESLEEKLMEAVKAAEELNRRAHNSGDEEFQRVFCGELESYLIGNLREFINSGSQAGSIQSLRDTLEGNE